MKNVYNFKQATPHAPSCDLPLNISTISFTLVMQLSADRVWMLPYHCDRWGHDHPISVVIFSDSDADSMKEKVMLQGCSAQQLTVQTVKKSKYDPKGTDYPVNILRNLALSVVKTSHVVYVDVDFWPASNLYSTLSQMKVKGRFTSDPYLAVVIPAFQMNRQCQEMKDCREASIPIMPVDKASLFALLKTRNAAFFDYRNYGGHSSTKYHTWKDQEAGAFVEPCIRSNRYEPYLAIRYCSDLPPFQEGFTGYGKNKMTWVMQLRRRGYLFSQLGGTFLIHYPHMHSKSRKEFDKRPNLTDADVLKESTPDESEHPLNLHKKSKDYLQDETKQGRLQKENKQDFHQENMKKGSHQESTKQQSNQIIKTKQKFVKSSSNNTKWSSQQKQNKKTKIHNSRQLSEEKAKEKKVKSVNPLKANKRAQVDLLFIKFRKWLDESIKDESRTQMCSNAQDDDQKLVVSS
ncbi:hypothetical protein ACHAWX_003351 [Stephanocyclus meneghinianus]